MKMMRRIKENEGAGTEGNCEVEGEEIENKRMSSRLSDSMKWNERMMKEEVQPPNNFK